MSEKVYLFLVYTSMPTKVLGNAVLKTLSMEIYEPVCVHLIYKYI